MDNEKPCNFNETYMQIMKTRYRRATRRLEKTKLINETIATTSLSRKYVIRLLTGSRVYKTHKGRSPTYSQDAHKWLCKIWMAMGQMCPKYLHTVMQKSINDYREAFPKAQISSAVEKELLRMSISTMTRSLRKHQIRPRSPNRMSGSKAKLAAQIPAGPGSLYENKSHLVLQVDTVALCGGDMHESFFWILHVTEATSQWSACAPVWNRGAEATTAALEHIFSKLPFSPDVIHVDNGSEFVNHHLTTYLKTYHPHIQLTRSRSYHKNDNNRIEQKNGSIIRALFGDLRFDDYTQLHALTELCDLWSQLNNYCIPCTRQIAKERHHTSKGITYSRTIDHPKTPYERLNEIIPQPPPPTLNSVQLRTICERTLSKLFRAQHSAKTR